MSERGAWRGGGRVLWYCGTATGTSRVLTDSASLCREAFMRSGLRGGGSGGSDAAIVGPAARPLICIPPLPPNNNTALLPLLYSVLCTVLCCAVLCARLTGIHYSKYGTQHSSTHNNLQSTHTHRQTDTHALQLPDILTTLQSNR